MIDLRVKQLFFDTTEVMRRVGAARRKNLSKAGAFIRTAARGLIRKSRNSSKPGKPPRSHVGLLKDFIFFSYDPRTDSVVVGAAKLTTRRQLGGPEPVPGILEHGGSAFVRQVRRRGRWVSAGEQTWRRAEAKRRRVQLISIEPRPYMGPAEQKVRDKTPEVWRNSITR